MLYYIGLRNDSMNKIVKTKATEAMVAASFEQGPRECTSEACEPGPEPGFRVDRAKKKG